MNPTTQLPEDWKLVNLGEVRENQKGLMNDLLTGKQRVKVNGGQGV